MRRLGATLLLLLMSGIGAAGWFALLAQFLRVPSRFFLANPVDPACRSYFLVERMRSSGSAARWRCEEAGAFYEHPGWFALTVLTLVVAHVWLHRNDREAQGFFVYFIGLASMGISVYKQLSFVVTGDAAPTYALFALLPLCIGIGLLRPMGRCTTGPSPFSSRPDPDASLPELVPGRKASARRARQRRKLRRRAAEAAAIAAAAAAKKP